jgi:tRNA (guanine37-N1)-methyltransferase
MSEPLSVDVITIFPGMLKGFLDESMLKLAVRRGVVRFRIVNPRDFTHDAHRTTDDKPYGGGPGMVMKPEPLCDAIESVATAGADVILMTPQGRPFTQAVARELATRRHLVFVCGHYEGVDERVREAMVTDELSVGDYVLTNGVLPAAVVIDAVVRLLPGALGGEGSTEEESFSEGLLEYPQYTRPPVFRGMEVPEVLRSGDHGAIAEWRSEQALARTRVRRPDLLDSGD